MYSDKIDELREYALLDGTEWGEMIEALCAIAERRSYISDELAEMVMKEIDAELTNVKACAIIEEEEFTTTHKVKTLVWYPN